MGMSTRMSFQTNKLLVENAKWVVAILQVYFLCVLTDFKAILKKRYTVLSSICLLYRITILLAGSLLAATCIKEMLCYILHTKINHHHMSEKFHTMDLQKLSVIPLDLMKNNK